MYKVDDIQIFIITHNRADLIGESIESILNQTEKVNEITVLDNESTDNTQDIVAQYASKGVKYIKTFGFLGNFNKVKDIADKKFVMLFHDDDILNPNYLSYAVKLLNKEKDVSALLTRYTEFFDEAPKFFPDLNHNYHVFYTQKDFAKYMFFCEHIAYATAIYRTDLFKKIDLEYDKYNKFNDWPFMCKFGQYGRIVLYDDLSAYFVRRHRGQDTWTYTNTPSLEQIINWDKFFYDIFFAKNDVLLRRVYAVKSTCFISGKYQSFLSPDDKKKYSLDDLYEMAKNKGLKIEPNIKVEKCKYFGKYIKYLQIKNMKKKSIKLKVEQKLLYIKFLYNVVGYYLKKKRHK